jgi:hypothetical protein
VASHLCNTKRRGGLPDSRADGHSVFRACPADAVPDPVIPEKNISANFLLGLQHHGCSYNDNRIIH